MVITRWALVAHAYNPRYSGGRAQEDWGLKPAQGNCSYGPILKKPITKKSWSSALRCKPWVQTPVLQKTNKQTKYIYIVIQRMSL
jgi:hypothetical protein